MEEIIKQYKLFLCQLNNGELDQRNLRRLELSMRHQVPSDKSKIKKYHIAVLI